jgi:hypothetical protein
MAALKEAAGGWLYEVCIGDRIPVQHRVSHAAR